jgi:serine/threonine protein kinase/WD40 repeat protein
MVMWFIEPNALEAWWRMVASGKGNEQGAQKPFFSGGSGEAAASGGECGVGRRGQVGPYELIGVLGEGGYGVVYLASRDRPIRRRVALKIVKPGMDSRQVIARFEAERQALALLDHPNIAHVYDAGTTPAGRPYFAMEYVEGIPITAYCDRHKLDLKERLRLFLQVCDAVQHAHQKGIIHRDLKPSNILVTAADDKPLVKVIDFGIAKALTQPLTERTLHTEQDQFVGTPDYMSPEQSEMDGHAVDTRSDVYSLGIVLYELLTGVLPFDPADLRRGGVDHIRTVIREEQPKTPSTRLTSLGGLEGIAQHRRTDPQTLTKTLRRELEWIPLKAMRKDPSRRYQAASELEADIENYLGGHPLLAGPESVFYRARKFVHRHAGAVAAASVIAASLLIGLIVSTAMYVRAEKAQVAEEAQRRAAEQERDRAVSAENEAQVRLAGAYEQQGRHFMQTGDLDRALVFLSQARTLAPERLTVRLLLFACLRRHPDSHLNSVAQVVPWEDDAARGAAFALSPDRTRIAILDADRRSVRIFDTDNGEQKAHFEHPGIEKLAFLPGNEYLVVKATGSRSDHKIEVLDATGTTITARDRSNIESGTISRLAEDLALDTTQLEQAYTRILISPKGDWFAFIDTNLDGESLATQVVVWDSKARMWQTTADEHVPHVLVGAMWLSKRAYSDYSDGKIVTLDAEGWVQRWRLPDCTFVDTFQWPATFGRCDPTGTRVITVQKGPTACLVTRRDNSTIRSFPGVSCLGFSPDGSRLITARPLATADVNATEVVCGDLWDVLDGRHVGEIVGAELTNWHFSPDGGRLITEHRDGSLQAIIPTTGGTVFEISAAQRQAVADLSGDGQWLLTEGGDSPQTACLWDLTTGQSYGVLADENPMEDLTSGWLCEEIDAVFAFSCVPPASSPRFGQGDSWLIASSGLWPCKSGSGMLKDVDRLVEGYVSLRLDRGAIRPASQAELLQARLSFYQRTTGSEADETIDCLFSLTDLQIASHELDMAAALFRPAVSLSLSDRPVLDARRRHLAESLAAGYLARADRSRRQNRHAGAVADYEACIEFCTASEPLNSLGWLLATSPQQKDPKRALAIARAGCEATAWQDWRLLATYAVACAEVGDFAQAVQIQEKAVRLLPEELHTLWASRLAARLALFRSHKPHTPSLEWAFPTEDLVGWWTFDERGEGTVFDSSGHGQEGVLSGDARMLHGSRVGVLQLIGDGALVSCPLSPALAITDAITVMAWVKDEGSVRQQDKSLVSVWNTWGLVRRAGSNVAGFTYFGLGARDNKPVTNVSGTVDIADGLWHHIAAVYDQTSVCLYVDGVWDGSATARADMGTGVKGVEFGGSEIPSDSTSVCLLDDVRIYHAALLPEDIAVLYEMGKPAVDCAETAILTSEGAK